MRRYSTYSFSRKGGIYVIFLKATIENKKLADLPNPWIRVLWYETYHSYADIEQEKLEIWKRGESQKA